MSLIYLWLNLGVILFPFILSFNNLGHFYKRAPKALLAIAFSAIPFLIWDIIFTKRGVWGFNPDYLLGPHLWQLPLEEYLFFISIPYACLFLFDQLNILGVRGLKSRINLFIDATVLLVCLYWIFAYGHLQYTFVVACFCFLLVLLKIKVRKQWPLANFYLCYGIILIPFLLVNGALTGYFTSAPIVWYNDLENLQIRIGSIPLEDTFYYLSIYLINVLIFKALGVVNGTRSSRHQ